MTRPVTAAPVRRRPDVASLSEHAAEQAAADRAARRARRTRLVLKGLVALVPVAALAWVLLGSSWLAVDRIEVVGEGRLSEAEVVKAAAVRAGTPLARVDGAGVEARVGRLAPVADVRVGRSWPGTLRVQVTERVPAAAVFGAGSVTLVDADGVLFGTERVAPKGVVRLQVTDPGPDDPATRAALQVHRALPQELRARIKIVRAASPSAVVLLTDTGKQVVWGAPGDTEVKAAAALALLGTDSGRIDVSAPGFVVRD